MLGEEESSAPVQDIECDSMGEKGKPVRIADELRGNEKLQKAVKKERIVPVFCLFCGACSTADEMKWKT